MEFCLRYELSSFAFKLISDFILKNGTTTGAFKELVDGRAELIVGDYWLKVNRLNLVDASDPYDHDRVLFAMPLNKKLTSLEKLIRPFSEASWMLILTALGFGVFAIFVILKFTSQTTQNFVLGRGIRNPYMNILIAIFGGSQHILPKRNFSRFLLMMFLLKCLILRTIYQGFLFEILQTNQFHRGPQTIDDIIEHKFDIYIEESSTDYTTGYSEIRSRFVECELILKVN